MDEKEREGQREALAVKITKACETMGVEVDDFIDVMVRNQEHWPEDISAEEAIRRTFEIIKARFN
jgi:hypothetical protein